MQKLIKAKYIQVGDNFRDTEHGLISVKEVIHMTNPVTRALEVKIRGPLNIVVKMDGEKDILVYRR